MRVPIIIDNIKRLSYTVGHRENAMKKTIISCFALLACVLAGRSAFTGEAERPVVPIPFNPGPPLNSTVSDFAPSLSPDGTFMVFNSKRDGQKYQDIYLSRYEKGQWSAPELMRELSSPYNDETPHVSMNGDLIIFASDRDGSLEMPRDSTGTVRVSFDLYWSRRVGGKWTSPVKVAGHVNTMFHERGPALSPDGNTLYFTRWPFGNSGDSVIMKSEVEYEGFGVAEALPEPFNTGNQDVGLIHTEDGFYFSSNRQGGQGGWDVYFVSCKNGVFGQAVNLGPLVNSPANEFYYSKNADTAYFCSDRPGGEGLFDIYKASFEIHAIYFDYDSAKIKKESYPVLDSIYRFLRENSSLKFEIIGHTDLHGSEEYNNTLSLKRAESVRDYFLAKGLDPSRFTVKGAGKSEPKINNIGPGYDEKNRRTEFKVLGITD